MSMDPVQQTPGPNYGYQAPGSYGYGSATGNMGYNTSGPAPVQQIGMSYGGTPINVSDPGMMDPTQLNPYASQYMGNINGLIGAFGNSAAGGAFNPNVYGALQSTQQQNLTTSLDNQYARMGLGGSSAEMGGVSSAINQNQMSWLNRTESDQMRTLQGMEGLNQMGYNEATGIQGQYSNFQDSYNQDILSLLGINQQANQSNNQLWGSIAQGAGSLGLGAAGLAGLGIFGGGSGPILDPTGTYSGWGSWTDPMNGGGDPNGSNSDYSGYGVGLPT